LVHHDDMNAVVLAKNLQDFIFRNLLEDLTNMEYSRIAWQGNLKINSANILKTHRPYLKQNQVKKLEEFYNREVIEYKETYPTCEFLIKGLITQEELKEILQQEIGFADLDKEFEYMD